MPIPSQFSIKQLERFLAVASIGHIGRAALALNMDQPSLTRMIKGLESDLGVSLFMRHSRGVVLTDAGQMFAETGKTIIQLLKQVTTTAFSRREDDDAVTLGLPALISPLVLPAVFDFFRNRWPEERLDCIEASSGVLERLCHSAGIDLGLAYDPPLYEGAEVLPILRESLSFIYPASWTLSLQPKALRLREIIDFPLALPRPADCVRRLILKHEGKEGVRLKPVFESDNSQTLQGLLLGGSVATVSYAQAFEPQIAAGRLVKHPLVGLTAQLCIVSPQLSKHRNRSADLAVIARAAMSDLVRDGRWPDATIIPVPQS